MALEQVGLEFVSPGAAEFLTAVREGAQAQDKITASSKGAAAGLSGVDTAARRAAGGVGALGKGANDARGGLLSLRDIGKGVESDLLGMAKGALGVGAAIGAIKGGVQLATVAANAEAARQSFDRMAQGAGTSGKALLASLQAAAGGTVAQTELIQNTNTALLLLGNDVATKLPALLQVARASAQATGQDVGYVFSSLVTGISRGSTELIDNAGITLSATEAYNTYAASIGKTAEQLTKAERSQAILSGVLTAGQAIVAQSGTAMETNAVKIQQAAAAWEDFKVAVGGALAPIVAGVAEATTSMLTFSETAATVSQDILSGAASFDEYRAKLDAIPDPIAKAAGFYVQLSEAQYTAARAMMEHGASAAQATAAVQGLTAFEVQLTGATQAQRDAFTALSPAIAETASQSEYNRVAIGGLMEAFMNGSLSSDQFAVALQNLSLQHQAAHPVVVNHAAAYDAYAVAAQDSTYVQMGLTEEILAGTSATGDLTQATIDKAIADSSAALEAQKLASFQQTLASVSSNVANGHYEASKGALVLAQRYGIAYGEALKLIGIQMQLARLGGLAAGAFKMPGAAPKLTGAVGIVGVGGGEQSVGIGSATTRGAGGLANAPPKPPRVSGGGGRGAGGGGGGAAAAQKSVDVAKNAAAKRQEIARQTGEKLQSIERAAGEKLLAIDQQYATRRLEAIRKLNEQIAADSANINFSQILNNFDLLNAELTEDQRAALNEREAAEATYQQRVAQAAEEARQIAAEGDAEYAQQYYEAKKAQAERQKDIDQRAAQAAREAGEDQQQAVQDTAAAATKANEDAANNDIAVAQAAAEARAKAKEDEKQKVIADAQEQSQAVIAASQSATDAVVAGFGSQAQAAKNATDAVNAYADAVRNLPSPPSGASSGGGGSAGATAAAGGGSFLTSGRARFVAGDNPGGVELVTVTPISGRGRTRVGSGVAHFAGGGAMMTGAGGGRGAADAVPDWVMLNAQLAEMTRQALTAGDATRALATATRIAGQQALDTAARQAVQEEKTKNIEGATTSALRAFMVLNPAITESGVDALLASKQITVQAAALIKGELATRRMARVTRDSAGASLIDSVQKRAQEAQTKLLEAQVQQSADAFLKLNPTIDAAGVASAVAAGQIDPLVAQLVVVEQQARAAEAELANLQTTANKPFGPDNGPLNFYQAQIDAQRALADATQYLAELRGDTEVKARQTEANAARQAQQAVEKAYADKRKEILATSDFENDYYDEQGNLQKGRISKLRDLENEYRQDREDAAKAVIEAEKAVLVEQQRVATNADAARALQRDLSAAQQQAERIRATDEAAAATYLQLRTQQLTEIADLERERANLTAQAALGDEGAKIQLDALGARLAAIRKAQEGELLLWREQQRQQVIAGIASARGIEEGMVEATPELLAEVNRIMDAIIRATNEQLDIHSPSRVMARRGMLAIAGLTDGIADPRGLAALRQATRETVAAIPGAIAPPMSPSQQAMASSSYIDNSINGIDARGSNWTEAQIRAIVNSTLDARTQRGYGTRATRGYGRS